MRLVIPRESRVERLSRFLFLLVGVFWLEKGIGMKYCRRVKFL